jgi:hypothetical protein
MKLSTNRSRRAFCVGLAASALASTSVRVASAAPAPSPLQQIPKPAAAQELWVQNFDVTELWSGPDSGAVFFGWLRKFSYLKLVRQQAERFYVFNPRSNNYAWVAVRVVGPSGPPPPDYLEPITVVAKLNLPGRIVGTTPIYGDPVADPAEWVRDASHNAPVVVEAQVKGTGSGEWYRLDSGEFVQGEDLRLPGQPQARYDGKWIDAELTEPTIVTMYEGDKAVASALAVHGVSAWKTPTGAYRVWRRVFNETMSSEGLGIPRNAPGGYYVENVLYTQYFTGDGAALHYNYWSSNFGYAGSHGCLGLNLNDSVWLWNWAELGTPVVVHY